MNNMTKANECLSAALTLLYMKNVIDKEKVFESLKKDGYDGLFDLLDEKYAELSLEEK